MRRWLLDRLQQRSNAQKEVAKSELIRQQARERINRRLGYTLPSSEGLYTIDETFTTSSTPITNLWTNPQIHAYQIPAYKWRDISVAAYSVTQQIQNYQQAILNLNNTVANFTAAWTYTTTTLTTGVPAVYTPTAPETKAVVAKKARAVKRAKTLLLMHLDIRQTVDFDKHGFFFVTGSEGNLYQIRTGRSHNVRFYDPIAMKPIWTLCAHPVSHVPDFDTMLAQKFMIEHDENSFIQLANRGTVYAREQEAMEALLVIDTLPQIETIPYPVAV